MPEITQAQVREYQQVAALLNLDIAMLAEVAKDESLTAAALREQINLVRKDSNEYIRDSKVRENRYAAATMLVALASTAPDK